MCESFWYPDIVTWFFEIVKFDIILRVWKISKFDLLHRRIYCVLPEFSCIS